MILPRSDCRGPTRGDNPIRAMLRCEIGKGEVKRRDKEDNKGSNLKRHLDIIKHAKDLRSFDALETSKAQIY